MLEKACKVCGVTKANTAENFIHGGKGRKCKECARAYGKQHYLDNIEDYKAKAKIHKEAMKEFVNQLKEQPCKDCGNSFPPVCMDFDHVSGEKLYSIGNLAGQGRAWDLLREELKKCELVCACCHRLRTQSRL